MERIVRMGLFSLLLALLLLTATVGPDFPQYMGWALAARSADISELLPTTVSPLGVPVSYWSHGPGFLFALGSAVLGHPAAQNGLFQLDGGTLLIGTFAAMLFWWSMFGLLARAAGSHPSLVLFGAAIAFVGTHAGFYSRAHASESLSLACVAAMAYWVTSPRQWQVLDVLGLAALGALLIVIRPHLALYAALGFVVMAYSAFLSGRRRLTGRTLGVTAAASLLVAIAIAQDLFVNRWMTGSALHLSAVFATEGFRTFDFARPEIAAVLVHPWHGLLTYHPLYGVGFVALVITLAQTSASGAERWFYLALLLILGAHLYVQGAWFCWWLGMQTYGMRGLAVTSVALVPVLLARMRTNAVAGRSNAVWIIASVASSLWSYALLWQGISNFYTYGELLAAQRQTATSRQFLAVVAPALAVAVASLRWRDPLTVAGSTLWALLFAYLIRTWHASSSYMLGALTALFAVAATVAGAPRPEWASPRRATEISVAALVLTAFLFVSGSFARLALHTEADIARGRHSTHPFRYMNTVPIGEIRASYVEYLRVRGFDEKKRALRDFLAGVGAPR